MKIEMKWKKTNNNNDNEIMTIVNWKRSQIEIEITKQLSYYK